MSYNLSNKRTQNIDCEQILGLDKSIRFVGMCTKNVKLLNVKYREGISPLLSEKELLYSIIKSVERNTVRKEAEDKLGPSLYSVTAYANVKRATISYNGGLIFISFEGNKDEFLIINKILKKIEDHKEEKIVA